MHVKIVRSTCSRALLVRQKMEWACPKFIATFDPLPMGLAETASWCRRNERVKAVSCVIVWAVMWKGRDGVVCILVLV